MLDFNLAFISHLPLQQFGGGMYAVTHRIHSQLQRCFLSVNFRRIATNIAAFDAVRSKLQRKLLHRPGTFYQFSKRSLNETATEVTRSLPSGNDAIFFRSSTRWIGCRPVIPYFVHTDAVFHTFFHNTFNYSEFITSDLQRIWDSERDFLEGAAAVFFESDWGLQKARSAYQLTGNNFVALGNGGGIDPPADDAWDGHSLRLVSVAKHFKQKGGDLVLEAFHRLKRQYAGLEWHIIGGRPEAKCESIDGIYYEGFLRTDIPEELIRFREIMANSFLLVHPTREDTNPLVLIEAAYFGCPSVSVDDFAIPELVVHGETGMLLTRPVTGESLAEAIEKLILDQRLYLDMRRKARERSLRQFQWNAIGNVMASHIHSCLA